MKIKPLASTLATITLGMSVFIGAAQAGTAYIDQQTGVLKIKDLMVGFSGVFDIDLAFYNKNWNNNTTYSQGDWFKMTSFLPATSDGSSSQVNFDGSYIRLNQVDNCGEDKAGCYGKLYVDTNNNNGDVLFQLVSYSYDGYTIRPGLNWDDVRQLSARKYTLLELSPKIWRLMTAYELTKPSLSTGRHSDYLIFDDSGEIAEIINYSTLQERLSIGQYTLDDIGGNPILPQDIAQGLETGQYIIGMNLEEISNILEPNDLMDIAAEWFKPSYQNDAIEYKYIRHITEIEKQSNHGSYGEGALSEYIVLINDRVSEVISLDELYRRGIIKYNSTMLNTVENGQVFIGMNQDMFDTAMNNVSLSYSHYFSNNSTSIYRVTTEYMSDYGKTNKDIYAEYYLFNQANLLTDIYQYGDLENVPGFEINPNVFIDF